MLPTYLLTNGQILDRRYQITGLLATGGFGQTYLAQDTKRPGNPVCVVKQLKSHCFKILEKAREFFTREGEMLEYLGEHPQIPRLLAYFEENGEFYLVQEYIEGKTLAQLLNTQKTLSEKQVINLLEQLLEILDFVHSKGVIHRDIKPANIICRQQDNKLVLIDFGAVKEISILGNQATIICSHGYAPPEQWKGKPNRASDIYAVGIIAIQALTGIHPNLDRDRGGFELSERGEIIWQNKTEVSQELKDILTKMSRKNEQERYQSVKEVLWILKQLNTFKIDRDFNKVESNTIIYKSVTFWQKLKLPISSAIGFFIIGVMSISLAQKLSPIENSSSIPQLSLKNKAIQGILHFNSQIEPIKNTYYDVYLFNGRKDKQVKIEINSNEFDPALTLLNLDRQVLAINDDISPHNFNSQIVITLPEDGKYQIIVRASQPGETGNYQLKASVQS